MENPVKSFWNSVRYYAVGLWNGVDDDHAFMLSAGIAYNVFLCVIPLSLILFQIFGLILQNDEGARQAVLEYLRQVFPVQQYGPAITEWVSSQFAHVVDTSVVPGVIAFFVLLWLSSGLFSSLRTSVNICYRIKPKRHMAILKLYDFGMLFVLSLFLLLTILTSPILAALSELGSDILPHVLSDFLDSAIGFFLPLAISVVGFLMLFKLLVHERISWRVAAVSTLVTAGLIEVMKYFFRIYLTYISSIGALYGAYAFLVAVALWAYYGGLVFVLGAEVGRLYRDHRRHEPVKKEVS